MWSEDPSYLHAPLCCNGGSVSADVPFSFSVVVVVVVIVDGGFDSVDGLAAPPYVSTDCGNDECPSTSAICHKCLFCSLLFCTKLRIIVCILLCPLCRLSPSTEGCLNWHNNNNYSKRLINISIYRKHFQ